MILKIEPALPPPPPPPTDAGDDAQDTRICAYTQCAYPRAEMLRFVIAPNGVVTPDMAQELPICNDIADIWLYGARDVVAAAIAENIFTRAPHHELCIQAPPDLPDRCALLMMNKILSLLGIARKKGAICLGFENTLNALVKLKARLIVIACDAASDSREKLARLAASQNTNIMAQLTRAQLSAALGQENIVFAAIESARLAQKFNAIMTQLEAYHHPFLSDASHQERQTPNG